MRLGGGSALRVFASGNGDYNGVGSLARGRESLLVRAESGDLLSWRADESLAEARTGRARKLDLNDL